MLPVEQQSAFLKDVASCNGVTTDLVKAVIAGKAAPVRTLDIVQVSAFLSMELQALANQYGNRQAIGDTMLDECMDIVLTRFKHLGLQEIREAYRMWATKELGDIPEAEMYGGIYNARHLSAVLSAYCEKRRAVAAQIERDMDDIQKAQIAKEQHEQRQAQFDVQFLQDIANARETITNWQDVPEYWYDVAERMGMFTITNAEKIEVYEMAKAAAREEITQRISDSNTNTFERRRLRDMLENTNTNFNAKAKAIAKKMVVFQRVLGLENF